ncbi:hypothetical protein QFZ38_001164 [Pseudomonas cedrina]|nr:hypothetical protein [Pseudomonas cedrina]
MGKICGLATGAIPAAPLFNCGSCRAPARLRRRWYCWHFRRLILRFRSLAEARQLPQGIRCVGKICGLATGAIPAAPLFNCGSCRAPARLRRRRHCWYFRRQTLRFRSLAEARQLPQGIGCMGKICGLATGAIPAAPLFNCGSCRAPARLRRRWYCWHFRRLILRFRSLAEARQLPQGIGCGRQPLTLSWSERITEAQRISRPSVEAVQRHLGCIDTIKWLVSRNRPPLADHMFNIARPSQSELTAGTGGAGR